MMVKEKLADLATQVDGWLKEYFEEKIAETAGMMGNGALNEKIWRHISEHCTRPGKRIRAALVYFGYKAVGGRNLEAIKKPMMAVELIHTALLMHDDFMDEDKIRRGRPTTQEFFGGGHFGDAMSVCVGDVALMAGFELLGESDFESDLKIKAMNASLAAIRQTGLGQALDVVLGFEKKVTEEVVLELHKSKTAVYTYLNPLQIGVFLGGGDSEDLKIIEEYSLSAGIAFQLQDDILGMFGDENKTGKAADSDIKQDKSTLLAVKAEELLKGEQKSRWQELYGKKDLNESDAQLVRELVKSSGSYDYSRSRAISHAKEALKTIPKMKAKGWSSEAWQFLKGVAVYMIEREF